MRLRKRGQSSTEYLAVISFILVLLIPFFIFTFKAIASRLVEYYATETANNIASTTVTISNLGAGSKASVPVRIQSVLSNDIGSDPKKKEISLTIPSGEIVALGAGNLAAGFETLTGSGLFYVPIQNILNVGVGIGAEPLILLVLPEDEQITFELVQEGSHGFPNKDIVIYGANFRQDTVVEMKKVGQSGPPSTPSFDYVSENILDVNQNFGSGSYQIRVVNADGRTSKWNPIAISSKAEQKK